MVSRLQVSSLDTLRKLLRSVNSPLNDLIALGRLPRFSGLIIPFGGRPVLRKHILVEVQDDHIVVRVTGTSYAASYYKSQIRLNSTQDTYR